jgi:hypothetical protein
MRDITKTTTIGEIKAWINSLPADTDSCPLVYRMAHLEEGSSETLLFDFSVDVCVHDKEDDVFYLVDKETESILKSMDGAGTPTAP